MSDTNVVYIVTGYGLYDGKMDKVILQGSSAWMFCIFIDFYKYFCFSLYLFLPIKFSGNHLLCIYPIPVPINVLGDVENRGFWVGKNVLFGLFGNVKGP